MTYTEALALQTEGKRIRLVSWPATMYVSKDNIESLTGMAYLPARNEIDSIEWEEYTGEKVDAPDRTQDYSLPPDDDIAD